MALCLVYSGSIFSKKFSFSKKLVPKRGSMDMYTFYAIHVVVCLSYFGSWGPLRGPPPPF